MADILVDWRPEHAGLYGRHTLKLRHRLAESGLFEDGALAELISRYPESHYNLHAMSAPEDPRASWTRGLIGGADGREVLEGVRAGRLWLNLRRVHEVDERFAKLLDAMFAEFEARVPGLVTFKRNMGVLVSSPRAQVFYHADVPGQSLWQVRGCKRIWIYPNQEPFLRRRDLEDMILGLSEEEIPYEPWFDEHAAVHDLEPGQMLAWPLNGPHRVVNEDVMNVSVTTEHFTPEIRRRYAVRYGNALLRRGAGFTGASEGITGPGFYAKAGLAAAHRALFRKPKASVTSEISFSLGEKASVAAE